MTEYGDPDLHVTCYSFGPTDHGEGRGKMREGDGKEERKSMVL